MTTTTNNPTTADLKEALASLWWLPLMRGILLVIFGILMFTQPGATLLSLLWFMGIYWIVDGVFSLIEGVRGHAEKSRIWLFLSGIVSILAGGFILGNPLVAGLISGSFLAYLIGFTVIVSGIMMIFAGRVVDGVRQWSVWGLIMGILYVLFGLFVVAHPVVTVATLTLILSIWAVVAGVIAIVMAFQVRGLATAK
ncbi:MAG: HdeD family acid-resistance protein [Caldilineaceae bacterium]